MRVRAAFADYDTLKTYYVGQGGNYNSSTRFRRYVGRAGDRPMLPQHDHAAADEMLTPNRWTTVRGSSPTARGSNTGATAGGCSSTRIRSPIRAR
ncbi:DUF6250 domain-containing protein [Caulobacter segnis]